MDMMLPVFDEGAMLSDAGAVIVEHPAPEKPAMKAMPAYFTDGEKLPWKGWWFTVKLVEVDGQRAILLIQDKPTAAAAKRSTARGGRKR